MNTKFRAWDSRNNEMVFSESSDCFYINTKGVLFMYAIPNIEGGITTYHKSYDVDQFTGLQDKNGVDIYEGDITKSVSEILRPFDRSVKTRTGEYVTKHRAVDYQPQNSRFGFAGKEYTSISQKHATKWLEVVGNIHSNPELLEK